MQDECDKTGDRADSCLKINDLDPSKLSSSRQMKNQDVI